MGVFTTSPLTWSGITLTSINLNAQIRDFINGFGAWTTYTPTLGNWTVGNGVLAGRYLYVQKTCLFKASFTFGTTSAAAASTPTLSLPPSVTLINTDIGQDLDGWFEQVGTAKYRANAYPSTTTAIALATNGTNGLSGTPSTTVPFTWATGHKLWVWGKVETA